jgi:hypothetical protein
MGLIGKNKLTNEQINIAIAKSCGWDLLDIPDYCNDLNAMHEAENSIPHPSYFYQSNLTELCGGENRIYRATASQRAEAFLRTLGKWEGAK